ncbi:DoxX family membrane protein [Sphingobacterium tabacisoli]|uniref:DoxX family membrane protein n=1 Tax=Sphingobacterium tabacisoli TaxID=2044855 RepID=A0ABW5L6N4_9SPHI|nr:DoxX family membrane protein [Sphingobacterium tabacisoli]
MMKNISARFSQLFLRTALSVTMLSAVADRLGLWAKAYSSWGDMDTFIIYTRKLTFFLPEVLSTLAAYIATGLELLLPLMLMLGYKVRIAAYGSSLLLALFAISMTIALGPKAPLDYSVWIGSAAAFLLATQHEYSK